MATNPETIENFKSGMLLAHGVDHPSKIPGFYTRVKKTKLEKYGDENYNNKVQIEKTCVERYGVSNMLKLYHPIGQLARMNNAYETVLARCAEYNVTPMFTREEYKGLHYENKYPLRCNSCLHEYETPLTYRTSDIDRPVCPKCNPNGKNIVESEIYAFLTALLPTDIIKVNDRTVLVGKELDFYLRDRKFAIEHNGLYWHAEDVSGKSREYHLNKLKSCAFHGIRLIHIFEDEWRDSPHIVKSIISSALGIYEKSIDAADCEIVELTTTESSNFVHENHIQGNVNSSVKYGLKYANEIVSIMTFGKDRFSNSGAWELHRFCDRLNYSIVGSASKLLAHFMEMHSPNKIITYADRRYFAGEVCSKLGFQFVSNTAISYSYVSPDFKSRLNRMKFMKHRQKKILENFDPEKTEWQNMQANGFDRIWDCGMMKFVWKTPTAIRQLNVLDHTP